MSTQALISRWGYIDGFEDIMAMETGFLQYTMELLKKEYARELQILNIEVPKTDNIPAVRFDEIKRLVSEKYDRKIKNPFDLEPEEETLISRYAKEEWNADFVFVTHYPSKKRPFYAMDDPEDPTYTLSFDLLSEEWKSQPADSVFMIIMNFLRRWRSEV